MTPPKAVTSHEISALNSENTPTSPVVEALRRQTANAVVLHGNYKQYHWRTFGPQFRDLHKLFDEFGEAVLASVDELAERVRMIGQDPPASLSEMLSIATVGSAVPGSSVREMIEEADRHALVVIAEFREAARVADDHNDPGTVDVCSRLVQMHEKQEWWLRDMLRNGDGL